MKYSINVSQYTQKLHTLAYLGKKIYKSNKIKQKNLQSSLKQNV